MDLFAPPGVECLPLPEAEVSLLRDIDLGRSGAEVLAELIVHTPWRAEHITLWGRRYPQPRLTAWYGDPGTAYRYSGLQLQPLPWSALLRQLKRQVEALAGLRFNSVLLNYYRDQRDSMGLHADDEPELGPAPVIASLSLGEQRTLVFRHRRRRDLGEVKIPLPDRSLLLMRGPTQRHWKHGIRKETRPCGPRVNLTFRQILVPR